MVGHKIRCTTDLMSASLLTSWMRSCPNSTNERVARTSFPSPSRDPSSKCDSEDASLTDHERRRLSMNSLNSLRYMKSILTASCSRVWDCQCSTGAAIRTCENFSIRSSDCPLSDTDLLSLLTEALEKSWRPIQLPPSSPNSSTPVQNLETKSVSSEQRSIPTAALGRAIILLERLGGGAPRHYLNAELEAISRTLRKVCDLYLSPTPDANSPSSMRRAERASSSAPSNGTSSETIDSFSRVSLATLTRLLLGYVGPDSDGQVISSTIKNSQEVSSID